MDGQGVLSVFWGRDNEEQSYSFLTRMGDSSRESSLLIEALAA